jgi:hypothetical protein
MYIALLGTVNVISLSYLVDALQQKDTSATTLKSFLESSLATKVILDARNRRRSSLIGAVLS